MGVLLIESLEWYNFSVVNGADWLLTLPTIVVSCVLLFYIFLIRLVFVLIILILCIATDGIVLHLRSVVDLGGTWSDCLVLIIVSIEFD